MDFFGKKAFDKVTGFSSRIIGYCQYATGCNQILLVPEVDEKGGYRDSHWFDEQRVEVMKESDQLTFNNEKTPGADLAAPIK